MEFVVLSISAGTFRWWPRISAFNLCRTSGQHLRFTPKLRSSPTMYLPSLVDTSSGLVVVVSLSNEPPWPKRAPALKQALCRRPPYVLQRPVLQRCIGRLHCLGFMMFLRVSLPICAPPRTDPRHRL